ncbi:hypothetical protein VNO77_16466 [Canavalia gladiata]|uniref:Uncharacterized protein n=1 Tax=Canavalia gladiata TaxID=3824 RepID=A0AAN9M5J9_CANGL
MVTRAIKKHFIKTSISLLPNRAQFFCELFASCDNLLWEVLMQRYWHILHVNFLFCSAISSRVIRGQNSNIAVLNDCIMR